MAERKSTLFVWKLKQGCSEEELRQLFNEVGGFMKLKFQAPDGERWGQCWVQFTDPDTAATAKELLKAYGLPSNPNELLSVDFAKNDLDNGGKGRTLEKGFGKGGGQVLAAPKLTFGGTTRSTLFVWKLKMGATEEELRQVFNEVGGFVNMLFQAPDGDRWGQAWARFTDPETAATAKELIGAYGLPSNPHELLSVDFAKNDLEVPGLDSPEMGAGRQGHAALGGLSAGFDMGGSYGKSQIPLLQPVRNGPYATTPLDNSAALMGAQQIQAPPNTGYTAAQMVNDLIESRGLPGEKWKNDENTIYVDGLPGDTTEKELLFIFAPFGAVLPGGASVHAGRGYGIVNFAQPMAASNAVHALNGCVLPDGSTIRVKPFMSKP